jgi:glycine/D-amino acid oxidase-like deaminating enzyme
MQKHDVVIVGGAIVGSAVAYFLKRIDPACDVAVVEPDSTYEFASTLRASGGARRQFSCPENIAMSNFSIDFIGHADELLAVDGAPAHVEWRQGGYLFIVGAADVDTLRANHAVQREHGVIAHWLDADALHARFPSMNLDGIAAGVHTPEDGWCDPNGLLQGLRRKARSLGARYVADRVVGIDHDSGVARAVRLASGGVLAGGCMSMRQARGQRKSAAWSACRCRSSRCAASSIILKRRTGSSRCLTSRTRSGSRSGRKARAIPAAS